MGEFLDKKIGMLADPKSSLHTKGLIDALPGMLDDYQKKMLDQAQHRQANADYLASYGSDCKAVKEFMAGLNPPEEKSEVTTGADGSVNQKSKKTTAAEKEAWLNRQRTENKELYALVQKQLTASIIIEDDKIAVEIAVQRLQNARVVLALKTAQLNFLAGAE